MNKEEFVTWFEEHMGFENEGAGYYRELVDYPQNLYRYVRIEEDYVVYSWEHLYMGGSEILENIFSFEGFIQAESDDTLQM